MTCLTIMILSLLFTTRTQRNKRIFVQKQCTKNRVVIARFLHGECKVCFPAPEVDAETLVPNGRICESSVLYRLILSGLVKIHEILKHLCNNAIMATYLNLKFRLCARSVIGVASYITIKKKTEAAIFLRQAVLSG